MRPKFDDLHDSGVDFWDDLYRFGEQQDELWAADLHKMAAKGLSPEPKRS